MPDRVSVMALSDTLAHFAELDDWDTVTLKDVADHATLMNQRSFQRCPRTVGGGSA